MIVDHDRKFVFVHIPKTGGDSIGLALVPHVQHGIIWLQGKHKHNPLKQILPTIGDEAKWRQYLRFAVIRNPWELIHSDWYFSLRSLESIEKHEQKPELRKWVDKLRAVQRYPDFAAFVQGEYLGRSLSFFPYYCQDETGRDLHSLVLRFERLSEDFHGVCSWLGFNPIPELPHANRTSGRPDYRTDYTSSLAEAVGEYAKCEIERFGYRFDG
jgi:hypothetical protein